MSGPPDRADPAAPAVAPATVEPSAPNASPPAAAPPSGPAPTPRAPRSLAPPAPIPRGPTTTVGHLRAGALLLVLTILVGGIGYPLVVTGFAQLVTPATANGSLVSSPNGTVIGSSLVASNLTLPWMFWPRPSPVDYDMFFGSAAPPGPGDPALVNETAAYVNETLSYMSQYGESAVNASVPLWWVSASGSGVDPDLTPEAALVQIPRIHLVTNLSIGDLTDLVNSQLIPPPGGVLGPTYVDVVNLDLALSEQLGR